MTQTPVYRHAIVRNVPGSFDSCIKPDDESIIDVGLAGKQHSAYRRTLQELGLELLTVAADERHPDCCFVEDTAVVAGGRAVILHMGAPSRVGEETEVRKILARHKKVMDLKAHATMDGGDVLAIENKLFVGLSERTNLDAVSSLGELMAPEGYEVIAVPLEGILHLKSACSYLGDGCVLVARGYFDDGVFSAYKEIIVHPDESYSANCLAINGTIVVSKGFPHTRYGIESAGFKTIELDMSEFRKGGGSLTCLSILL